MKTAFMRQLFSGVNFGGRLVGPRVNQRGPRPRALSTCTRTLEVCSALRPAAAAVHGRWVHSHWMQTPLRSLSF